MNVLLTDLKGFLWLFLVPVSLSVIKTEKRFHTILSCILAGAVTQAALALVINFICSFIDDGIALVYQRALDTKLGMVTSISHRIYRIFLSSCPYLTVGCAIAVFRQAGQRNIRIRYVLSIVLCLSALLLTFTRSVYGCAFVVACCTLGGIVWIFKGNNALFLRFIKITAAAAAGFLFMLEFTFNASYLNFALSRTLGIPPAESIAVVLRSELCKPGPSVHAFEDTLKQEKETTEDTPEVLPEETKGEQQQEMERQEGYLQLTQESDTLRAVTQSELWTLIRKNPVFGNGLGAHAPSRANGLDEYFYLDMLARTGIVGLTLYLLPFAYLLTVAWKRRDRLMAFPEVLAALSGMVGFWAVTWFNPWMNAVLGIAFYALNGTVLNVLPKTG